MFRLDPSSPSESKALAANQGLYNGFLAAGLVWGLVADPTDVQVFFLACVIVAGAYGAVTVDRRILVVQAVPALLARAGPPRCTGAAAAGLTPAIRGTPRGCAVDSPRCVAPLPLLADGGREAELEDRVEGLAAVASTEPSNRSSSSAGGRRSGNRPSR